MTEWASALAAQQQQQQSLSPAGLRFIECHEAAGCQPNLTVYDASGNKHLGDWTIGYGHKVKSGEDFSKGITADQAADLLRADVQTAVDAVNSALRYPTTFQSQFDAMVSLAYNIGGGAFARSTLVQRWNSRGVVEDPTLFTRWSRTGGAFSPGLYARREEEYTLFNMGQYP
jgi:lysozyme